MAQDATGFTSVFLRFHTGRNLLTGITGIVEAVIMLDRFSMWLGSHHVRQHIRIRRGLPTFFPDWSFEKNLEDTGRASGTQRGRFRSMIRLVVPVGFIALFGVFLAERHLRA